MTILRKTALAVAIAAGASSAAADPLSQLFFSQAAGWVDPELTYNGGGSLSFSDPSGGDAPAGTFDTMTWTGGTSGASSISLTSYTSDTTTLKIDPNGSDDEWNEGDLWAIDQLLQTNEVLSGGPFPNPLWIADTLANFRVFDDAVGGNEVASDLNSDTRVTFWETPNGQFGCASPSPLYDAGVVTTTPSGTQACDDIYRVPLTDFAPLQFTLDGYIYTINFVIVDGVARDNNGNAIGPTLTCFPGTVNPLCAGAGVTVDGQVRVYTPEFAPGTTELFIAAFWEVVPVPAPGVLGLMGLGLAGLGFSARRRRAA